MFCRQLGQPRESDTLVTPCSRLGHEIASAVFVCRQRHYKRILGTESDCGTDDSVRRDSTSGKRPCLQISGRE